jgi:two-component system chemotaxis response regulator CheY
MENLSDIRVLMLARKSSSTQILRTVFALAGLTRVVSVEEARRAIDLLRSETFHAVFMEGALEFDGQPFALAARRLPGLLNPMIPIFAVYPEARKRDVEGARDLGVHDVICRPVSPKTVMAKLRAVLKSPRPFILAPGFFGPDRRSKARAGNFGGKDRRVRTAKKAKLTIGQI